MEWLTSIKKILKYIENNLNENISINECANIVNISPMFLDKGFKIMTGYSISEYIRNRRLYSSAIDLLNTDEKIIDIAYKYQYATPESFTKAFARFHNATPREVRNKTSQIRSFLPLTINIKITGGYNMKYTIKELSGFKVIGFQRNFSFEESHKMIPKFWDEIFTNENYQKIIKDNGIGEYGVCIDNIKESKITYIIAGKYDDSKAKNNLCIYEFEKGEWAIFDCVGPMPKAIQEISDKIFKEWLPGNPDFELRGGSSIEWYDKGDMNNDNYHSQIWIPIKRKIINVV